MQEELENQGAVTGEVVLEGVDIGEAMGPEVIVDLAVGNVFGLDEVRVDPDDQDFFVIRSVEDSDLTASGDGPGIRQRKL